MTLAVWGGLSGGSGDPQSITARGVITRVYQMLGVLRSGQTPSSDQLSDGLLELNELIDSWNTERLNIRAIAREAYDLTAGSQELVVDSNLRFDAAGLLRSGSTRELQVNVLAADPRLTGLAGVYYDGDATLVLSEFAQNGDQLVLYRSVMLSTFGDLDSAYGVPTGYALAIRFALAAQIAPAAMIHTKIPAPLLDRIEMQAREYKARIQTANLKAPELMCDSALLGERRYDWRTGG